MALCLVCGNNSVERILLTPSTYSALHLDWPDINILDTLYEPSCAVNSAYSMPRKSAGPKPAGLPRAPIAVRLIMRLVSTLLRLRSAKDAGNARSSVVVIRAMVVLVRIAELAMLRLNAIFFG